MPQPKTYQNARTFAAFALVAFTLLAIGCGSEPPPRREANRQVEAYPADPAALWTRQCSACHQVTDLADRGVVEIQRAIREVNSMRRFRGRLTDAQIEAVAQMIAERNAEGATGDNSPSPDREGSPTAVNPSAE